MPHSDIEGVYLGTIEWSHRYGLTDCSSKVSRLLCCCFAVLLSDCFPLFVSAPELY